MGRTVYARETSGYGRALSFFDIIYGFSITLLIANLDVPPAPAWASLGGVLSHGVGNQLLGFLISFLVIAAFWRRNHELLDRFTGIDSRVIMANLVAAGFVIFIPFTTQGMSDSATSNLPLPTAVYAVNIAAAMLAQSAMAPLAELSGLTKADPSPDAAQSHRMRRLAVLDALVGPVVFLVSVPLAYLWGGDTAKLFWLLLVIAGPLSARALRRREPMRHQGERPRPH